MNTSSNQNLTPERYEEIKKELENENLEKFPSLFQQARNLAKQAWVSGTGVLQGKPLLASAEKAYKRLEVCAGCEFFKETRCIKCGCFMEKKAQLELSQCPANKWGPELQSESIKNNPNQSPSRIVKPPIVHNTVPIDLETFSQEDKEKIKELAERSLFKYDGRFSYKDVEYQAMFKKNSPTQYFIYDIPPSKGKRPFLESYTLEKRQELMGLARGLVNVEKPVEFVYENVLYRVTLQANKKLNINLIREVQPSELDHWKLESVQ